MRPSTLSICSRKTGRREYFESMTRSRASRTHAVAGSAAISVRGVIISLTRVSPNSMIDWMSSPSSPSMMPSSSPTSMRA
jgi:hypothetical protein